MADHKLVDEVFSADVELAKRVHDAMRMPAELARLKGLEADDRD
jgi:hypothetical protein